MQKHNEEFIWAQRYRPKTVQECILPVAIKQIFQDFVDKGQIPNLMLFGKAGTGKTTIAFAMAEEIGADLLFINASSSGVDEIKDKVTQFCSTISFDNNLKIVFLDECDSHRFKGGFEVLRPVMEQFSKNCRFILTGNTKANVPEAIESRCSTIDFVIPKSESPQLAAQFMKRLRFILDSESITYDQKVLVELIKRYFPNNRKIINELQKYASSGSIDVGVLANFSDDSFNNLVTMIKEKRFTDARTWMNENSDMDAPFFYKTFYEICSKKIEPASIPELVLILAKYQFQGAFSVDQEINNTACVVELMTSLRFK